MYFLSFSSRSPISIRKRDNILRALCECTELSITYLGACRRNLSVLLLKNLIKIVSVYIYKVTYVLYYHFLEFKLLV